VAYQADIFNGYNVSIAEREQLLKEKKNEMTMKLNKLKMMLEAGICQLIFFKNLKIVSAL
jgi:hypothetical protein